MVNEDAADVEDGEQELDEAEADDGATILGLVDGQTGREEAKVRALSFLCFLSS